MSNRLASVWSLALIAAACGDGSPDAASPDATSPDTATDPCSYREAIDSGNANTPEPTGLTIGNERLTICGQIDPRPPLPSTYQLDSDRFGITVGDSTQHMLRLEVPRANEVDQISVAIWREVPGRVSHYDTVIVQGTVALIPLKPSLEPIPVSIRVVARNMTEPSTPIPYTISIEPFDLQQCAAAAAADHVETNDGVENTGNDVIEMRWAGAYQSRQTTADDAPEATGLTVVPSSRVRIDGDAGLNAGYGDMYRDRDAYAIETGAATTMLALRLDWEDAPGTDDDTDLDIMIFPAVTDGAAPVPRLAGGNGGELVGPELTFVAVTPATSYWLLVANAAAETATKPYRLTVCGEVLP
jgi:hypothetical protein